MDPDIPHERLDAGAPDPLQDPKAQAPEADAGPRPLGGEAPFRLLREAREVGEYQYDGEPRIMSTSDMDLSSLDQDALRVISRLQRFGHLAYLVGGCVRDLLVGRRPKDYDLATDAHPRQIKRLFRNGRVIGRRFRLVHIHYGKNIIETATFRRDPITSSGDDDLLITEDNEYGTASEDARRRDFTVNGLFLDPTAGVILDYVGGLDDLDARLLRTIGDPSVRMAEDPVRLLRAVKFATRLDFHIHDDTWAAMKETSEALSRSAPPRVLEEILRLLRSGTSLGAFRMLHELGALAVILPRIADYLDDAADQKDGADGYWRLLEALDSDVHGGRAPSTALCLALLFLPIVDAEFERRQQLEPDARIEFAHAANDILSELTEQARLSRREVARARRILVHQRRFIGPIGRRFRPLLFMRSEEFPAALELFRLRASARGQGWDIYEGWCERYRKALAASPEDMEDERKKTRRRRRRGRRRKRSGQSTQEYDGDSETISDPTD